MGVEELVGVSEFVEGLGGCVHSVYNTRSVLVN